MTDRREALASEPLALRDHGAHGPARNGVGPAGARGDPGGRGDRGHRRAPVPGAPLDPVHAHRELLPWPSPASPRAERTAAATAPGRETSVVPAAAPQPPGVKLLAGGLRLSPLHDHREVLVDERWPWCAVGQVHGSHGATATGMLVGPDLVLTSRHAMPWADDDCWVRFVAGRGEREGVLESYAHAVVAYQPLSGRHDELQVAEDFAVLRLRQPLGLTLGWAGTQAYDPAWDGGAYWISVQYAGDVAGGARPAVEVGVALEQDDQPPAGAGIRHLRTAAGFIRGASGGPIIGWFGDEPRIVAVVSGEDLTGGVHNYVAAGWALVRLVANSSAGGGGAP